MPTNPKTAPPQGTNYYLHITRNNGPVWGWLVLLVDVRGGVELNVAQLLSYGKKIVFSLL